MLNLFQEMKFQKEHCSELIEKILHRSSTLFSTLLQIAQSQDPLALIPLQKDLMAYWRYGPYNVLVINLTLRYSILQHIHQGLCDFGSRGVFKRLVDRGTAKLDKYNRMIDDFNDDTLVSSSAPFNGSVRCFLQFKMLARLEMRSNAGVQPASSAPLL